MSQFLTSPNYCGYHLQQIFDGNKIPKKGHLPTKWYWIWRWCSKSPKRDIYQPFIHLSGNSFTAIDGVNMLWQDVLINLVLGGELPTNRKWVKTLVISMGFLWGQVVHLENWGEPTYNPPKRFVGSWPPSRVFKGPGCLVFWMLDIKFVSLSIWDLHRLSYFLWCPSERTKIAVGCNMLKHKKMLTLAFWSYRTSFSWKSRQR